jgi:hypothetical protein
MEISFSGLTESPRDQGYDAEESEDDEDRDED